MYAWYRVYQSLDSDAVACDYDQLLSLFLTITGRYWQKVIDERKKKPSVITLADKNAPNEEVWKLVVHSVLRLTYSSLSRLAYSSLI